MKRRLKKAWRFVALGFLRAVFRAARWVPMPLMLRFGTAFGRLAFQVSPRYRKVALKNLDIAYGSLMSRREKLQITRAVFVNFAKAAMEFPVTARMQDDAIKQLAYLSPQDSDRIKELFARDKGLIVLSAHLGNFELMARRFVVEGFKFTVIVRNDDDKGFSDLVNDIRVKAGYNVIGRGEAARTMLKLLRSGSYEAVGMLPDQKSDEVFVPFFGKLAGTVAGPAVLSLRTGAPILPVFCVRVAGERHRVIVGEPICAEPTNNKEADIEAVMTQVNLAIEKVVREYPEQWLWLHDRWRVKPPAEVVARWEASQQQDRHLPSAVC